MTCDRGARSLTDAGAVALAASVAAGCAAARPAPPALVCGMVLIAVARRWPAALCLAGALAGSTLAARAWAGLGAVPVRPFRGVVTLATDPVQRWGRATAVARVPGGRRLELQAAGSSSGSLLARSVGDRLAVEGTTLPSTSRRWDAPRHVAGRLQVRRLEAVSRAGGLVGAANRVRELTSRGASVLGTERAGLFLGIVLGDDRDQPALVADDFRAAGLTHLLAVSGQNVAFVLAAASPVLRRLRLVGRWAATLAVIVAFAAITRFEPSVLRASALAALAVTTWALGRVASPVRLLALAVVGLLLVDPLLVLSLGFGLSVAAAAGIVLLSGRLVALVPGPLPFRRAVAVTGAAQLGAAPLVVAVFGGVPVASLPANLLAEWAAGVVMGWGVVAGPVAGLLGPVGARLLHAPDAALLAWIALVARVLAALPLGVLRPVHLALVASGAAARAAHQRWGIPGVGVAGGLLVLAALLAPSLGLRRPAPVRVDAAPGVELWRAGGGTVVVLGSGPDEARSLQGLREAGVRRVDCVVLARAGSGDRQLAASIVRRWSGGVVLAPPGIEVATVVVPAPGWGARFGGLEVRVRSVGPEGVDAGVVAVARPP